MRVETLLPLGKLDPGLRAAETPLDLGRVVDDARLVESLGYDGLAVEETKVDPYVVMALAAAGTTRLRLTTAVAMAFPRSPTVTAMSAWSIQKLSRGRFVLGLGSQVRGHITRRFGLTYRPPGPWMRDYVRAVRAVWAAWQQRAPLAFESPHYNLSLMVPLFDPGPIEHPDIPIHVAAVNPTMCRFVGEVADGLRPHPVCTPRYIRDVMLPAMRAGAAAAGRSPALAVAMKPLVCAAPDEATLASAGAGRAGARGLLRIHARAIAPPSSCTVSATWPPSWRCSRAPSAGRRCPPASTTRSSTPTRWWAPTPRSGGSSWSAIAVSSPTWSSASPRPLAPSRGSSASSSRRSGARGREDGRALWAP